MARVRHTASSSWCHSQGRLRHGAAAAAGCVGDSVPCLQPAQRCPPNSSSVQNYCSAVSGYTPAATPMGGSGRCPCVLMCLAVGNKPAFAAHRRRAPWFRHVLEKFEWCGCPNVLPESGATAQIHGTNGGWRCRQSRRTPLPGLSAAAGAARVSVATPAGGVFAAVVDATANDPAQLWPRSLAAD